MNTHTQEGNGKNGNGGGKSLATIDQGGMYENIERAKAKLIAALPGSVDRDRWMALAVGAVRQNEKGLMQCDATSVLLALFGAARLGLELAPEYQHCAIVPRQKKATLQIMYQGIIELAMRSCSVDRVCANIVYTNEDFDVWADETGQHFRHRPVLDSENQGDPRGAYAAWYRGSELIAFKWMPASAIERIRDTFAPRDKDTKRIVGPWADNEEAMWLKTPIRASSKLLRKSAKDNTLGLALRWDEQAELGHAQTIDADLDAVPTQALPTGRRKVGASNSEATTDEATSPESSEGETFGFQSNGAHSNNGTPPAGSESEKRLNFLVGRMMVVCNCEREEASDRVFMFLDEIEARATDLGDDDTHRIVCQKVEACGKK